MKNLIQLFITSLILVSCASNYITKTKIEKVKPENQSPKPIFYFFEASSNTQPDDAEYIGTFDITPDYAQARISGGQGFTYNDLGQSLEKAVKKAGGNLALIDDASTYEKVDFMKGKIYLAKEIESTGYNEYKLKDHWKIQTPDALEGIYEFDLSYINNNYSRYYARFGLLRNHDSTYTLIYLSGFSTVRWNWGFLNLKKFWQAGDPFAYFSKTEKPNLYNAKVYDLNKFLRLNGMLKVDNGNIIISSSNSQKKMMKVYPDSSAYENILTALTGFALDENRILTCNHGLTNSSARVFIKGINGDFDNKVEAVIEYSDKENDLAVLKLLNTSKKISYTPFSIALAEKSIAEEIFVLGFPWTKIMGDDIKLSNGIINSTSGYAGNMNKFQFSAPIQPGNSGSPLYDKNGNIIGIVSSGIKDGENVGYALKMKYINDFFIKNNITYKSPEENYLKDMSLADKVKKLQNSIFIIEVIDTERPEARYRKAQDEYNDY